MKALAARRRHPLATVVLLLLGLLVTGTAYATVAPGSAEAGTTAEGDAERGRELFLANCSTCHGDQATGTGIAPSLVGVGAAAVDFQVGTGRMPMQATAPQAPNKPRELTEQDTADLAAYVASLGPGPAIPDEDVLRPTDDPEALARGGELFRINCAMCHNVAGAGGALTRGKWAPALDGVSEKHIYEAMATGPQSMPVFNDANLSPEEKNDIISYLKYMEERPSAGGLSLGSLGPVSEGLFVWVGAMALLIGAAVWLGAKSS
ncbi:cytochrome bc1 complex diheme cytochrome c subunit [Thalassiella azotivora]